MRELILGKPAGRAKCRWFSAHSQFRPETRKELAGRKGFYRLPVGIKPKVIVAEIVDYLYSGPVWQPGAVDNKTHRQGVEGLSVDYFQQLIPLVIGHDLMF